MDDQDEQIVVAEMIASIAMDVLARLDGDSEARYRFFRDFVALAKRTVSQDDSRLS